MIDRKTGQLTRPSPIMRMINRSRDAVVRAANLRNAGFLIGGGAVPTDDPTGKIQVQQTSNAYRLFLPPRAAKLIEKYKPAPSPPMQRRPRKSDATMYARRTDLPPGEFVDDAGFDPVAPWQRPYVLALRLMNVSLPSGQDRI